MMFSLRLLLLALPCFVVPGSAVACPSTWADATTTEAATLDDELEDSLQRWLRDYRRGVYADYMRGKGMSRYRPYLTPELRRRVVDLSSPSRQILGELELLLRLAAREGSYAVGELLIDAWLYEERRPPKEGARPSWYVRRELRKALSEEKCSEGVQSAFMDRLKKGLEEKGESYEHEDPQEAARLLPVIGRFQNPASRVLLERLLLAQQVELAIVAAESLAELGSGAALPAVARLLERAEDGHELGRVSSAIVALAAANSPPPEEGALKYALDVSLAKLRKTPDWRGRLALLPILRAIRGVATIPVLIEMLESGAEDRDPDAFSGTLRKAVQDALVDLTGFFAPASEPEKWRKFWESEKDGFALAPVRKEAVAKGGTVSKGFFGIPVSGTRVIFVLDVSGSMRMPLAGQTMSGGSGARSGMVTTKLKQAKDQLLLAVRGLAPDAKFNVIFFESRVSPWQRRLVPANDHYKKAIERSLAGIKADGGTALYDGLDTGLRIQERRERKSRYRSNVDEVFLLSDGLPSPRISKIWEPDQILETVTDWNQGARVRIHTVFLRTVAPPGQVLQAGAEEMLEKAEAMMRDLAKKNWGEFRVF